MAGHQEKVPITEKIKDKLHVGHSHDTTPADKTVAHSEEHQSSGGVVGKVKDALGMNTDKHHKDIFVDPTTGQQYEEKTYPTLNIKRLEPVGSPATAPAGTVAGPHGVGATTTTTTSPTPGY